MRMLIVFSAVLLVLLAPATVLAEWSDNFDSYVNGSALHGQGGWEGWNGSAAATAYVSNLYSRSTPQSAEIRSTSDCVQQFAGVNSGQWIFTGWGYIPGSALGEQYWILVNTYPASASSNWSLQLLFDMTTNTVEDPDNAATPPMTIIRDQWVEVRVEIDFAADTQSVFYNNVLFTQKSWTAGTAPGGALNLAALDLFSNGANSIYWDDLWLRPDIPSPVENTTWGRIKAGFGN